MNEYIRRKIIRDRERHGDCSIELLSRFADGIDGEYHTDVMDAHFVFTITTYRYVLFEMHFEKKFKTIPRNYEKFISATHSQMSV